MSSRSAERARLKRSADPAKRAKRSGIPVLVDHPRAGEALSMVVEWVSHTIATEKARGESRGGQVSYVEMISNRIRDDRERVRERPKVVKTYVEKNPDGSYRRVTDLVAPTTAEGRESLGGVKPTEGSNAPITQPIPPSVAETQKIMDDLERTNFATYFVLLAWVQRVPANKIAKEIGCHAYEVTGHLLAATIFFTTHIVHGTYAQSGSR